ncbi:hypothetical protein A3K80_04800 [Candidatus Bathyarchaeota archaeon RBG_13_38_9]|nr:MAG: hypothetical protein A3K80_04800 [Candidatus Bathyarchaeota archaeon RBG_13_38_9]
MSSSNKSKKVSLSKDKQRKQTMRQFAFEWRREPAIIRVEKPTRIDRAKRLGYKAKQGFVVVRARTRRSGARKKRPSSGRRQKAMGVTKIKYNRSYQQVAEGRVAKKYPNMEVLNSYYLWADGKYFWTEVILIDPNHSSVMNDPHVNWISKT